MLTGFLLALGVWIIVIQLPFKELWLSRLWIVDAATSFLLIQVLFTVRSTEIVAITTYAAISFTVIVHLWGWIWRRVY